AGARSPPTPPPIWIHPYIRRVPHPHIRTCILPVRINTQPPPKPGIIHSELELVPARAVVLLGVLPLIPISVGLIGDLSPIHCETKGIVIRPRYYGRVLVGHQHLIKEHPIRRVTPIVYEDINKSRLLN